MCDSNSDSNSVILARVAPDKIIMEFCLGPHCQLYKMDLESAHRLSMALSEVSQPRTPLNSLVQSVTVKWKDSPKV